MGRYSPTVVPQVPDPLQVVDSMWSGYLGHRAGERAERGLDIQEEGLEIRKTEAGARARANELDEYRQGFRRGRRPNMVPDENLPATLRRGARVTGEEAPALGLQPSQKEGLPALRDRLSEAKAQYEPEIVAKPGALVPGMGIFADRPITSSELAQAQQPEYGGMVPDPQYDQVTEDTYFDPSGTPDARMLDRQIAYDEHRRGRNVEEEQAELQRRAQALVAAGIDPERAMVEAMNMDVPGESSSGGRPYDALTMNQAMEYYYSRFRPPQFDEYGEFAGYEWAPGWDEEKVLEAARAAATGDYSVLDPEDISTGGINEGEYMPAQFPSFEEYLQSREADPFGSTIRDRGGDAPVRQAPASEPALSDEEVIEMRELYGDMEANAARAELAEIGFSGADIERIIGG